MEMVRVSSIVGQPDLRCAQGLRRQSDPNSSAGTSLTVERKGRV